MEKDPFNNQNNLLPPLTQQEFESWQQPEGQPVTHTTLKLKSLDQLFTVQTELPNPLENRTNTDSSTVSETIDSPIETTAHEEQPVETLELNIEDGPVEPISVTTAIVFGGIGRAITSFRLGRAERKLKILESNDRVIKHAPQEAEELRGFKSDPLDPEDSPIRLSERVAYNHRDAQGAKKRKQHIEQSRLRNVYGESAPALEPRIRQSTSGTAAADRWNKTAEKLEKIDRGMVVSFEPRGREGVRDKLTRQSAQRKHDKADRIADTTDRRLERGAQGNTLPGEVRQNRINEKRRKIANLKSKLGK